MAKNKVLELIHFHLHQCVRPASISEILGVHRKSESLFLPTMITTPKFILYLPHSSYFLQGIQPDVENTAVGNTDTFSVLVEFIV